MEIIEYNYSVSILLSFFSFYFVLACLMLISKKVYYINLSFSLMFKKTNAFVVLMKLFGLHINAVNGSM